MGTCCFANRPPEKFVGRWTDNRGVELRIHETGNISYTKETRSTNTRLNGLARFKDNKFVCCCCCCSLRGAYTEEDSEPTVIVDGIPLKKRL